MSVSEDVLKAVVQRVSSASVNVDGETVASIGGGLMVFLGLRSGDGPSEIEYMASRIPALRIFEDDAGKMNLSVRDVTGSSFVDAMPVEEARRMWPQVERAFSASGIPCAFGVFQGDMKCSLVNDGPVTLILDSADTR